jgi:fatty-acyl-CoA synthase
MGSAISSRENPAKTAKFSINPGVIVVSDDGKEVEPGSQLMGKIGTSGLVPEGYYKDQKKSDETFKEYKGVRYSFPGDYATVEADGTIKLLGRGSNCINTAGEKVYPEEVEEALKLTGNQQDRDLARQYLSRKFYTVLFIVSINYFNDIEFSRTILSC